MRDDQVIWSYPELVKILSWNIHHQTKAKRIHPDILRVIQDQSADCVALSEYVDGDGRSDFKTALQGMGYTQIFATEALQGHNQLLLASKIPFETITLPTHDSHPQISTNMILFEASGLRLLAARIIMGKGLDKVAWSYLNLMIKRFEPDLIFGDLNAPRELIAKKHLRELIGAEYRILDYEGPSYMDKSAIDHAIVRDSAKAKLLILRDVPIGTNSEFASDHAPLIIVSE